MELGILEVLIAYIVSTVASTWIHYKDFANIKTSNLISLVTTKCFQQIFVGTCFYHLLNYTGDIYFGHHFESAVSFLDAIITYTGSEKDSSTSLLRSFIAFNMRYVSLHFDFYYSFLLYCGFSLTVYIACYYFANVCEKTKITKRYQRVLFEDY